MMEENYVNIVSRLEENGLPKGMAVLLYGSPGTGKTETAMQWARKCGRDILPVDISRAKSMWYGEIQKQVKSIFTKYKNLCRESEKKPILLFNEADALFSTRQTLNGSDNGGSVHQTENAIQNIIQEEMEKMDGIMIATTNLEGNLDGAFERRFLYKIHYDKPGTAAKRKTPRNPYFCGAKTELPVTVSCCPCRPQEAVPIFVTYSAQQGFYALSITQKNRTRIWYLLRVTTIMACCRKSCRG